MIILPPATAAAASYIGEVLDAEPVADTIPPSAPETERVDETLDAMGDPPW